MADPEILQSRYRRNDLTAEYVRSLLDYDPKTGVFTWKYRTNLHPRASGWNARFAGKIAGRRKISNCYFELAIHGRFYLIHRLAWLWMTGEWPKEDVDHRDTNKSNNKWENLREANQGANNQNKKIKESNTTGFKGVIFREDLVKKPFCARVKDNKKSIHLGYFATAQEAHDAYCEAAKKYHGEFARFE